MQIYRKILSHQGVIEMKFKSEYILTKKHYKEASLWSSKFRVVFITLFCLPLALICFATKQWVAFCIPCATILYFTFSFIKSIFDISKEYNNAIKIHQNKDIKISVTFKDNIIEYKTPANEYLFRYKDISRLWQSEHLYIIFIVSGKKKSLISIRKKDVNRKEFLNFIKEKRK